MGFHRLPVQAGLLQARSAGASKGKHRRGQRRMTTIEAARDYDQLARLHHGRYARTNASKGLLSDELKG